MLGDRGLNLYYQAQGFFFFFFFKLDVRFYHSSTENKPTASCFTQNKALHDLGPCLPYDFSILYSPSCSLHFQPPGFFLLLKHNKHVMVSGFLNLLNSMPGILFPKIHQSSLFQFLHISTQIYFLTEAFFHHKVPLCSLTLLFLHTYSFVYLFSSTRT